MAEKKGVNIKTRNYGRQFGLAPKIVPAHAINSNRQINDKAIFLTVSLYNVENRSHWPAEEYQCLEV